MRFQLKPLSFGEVLDGAFKIFRGHLAMFLVLAAGANVPTILTSAWFGVGRPHEGRLKMPPIYFPITLGTTLITLVMWGTMAAAAVQIVTGEPTSLGKAYARFSKVFAPALGGTIVAILIGGLGLVALIVPGVIYLLNRGLFLPVLLVEGGTHANAFSRSKALVLGGGGGRKGRLFGASFLFGALAWALHWGAGMLIPEGLKATYVGAVMNQLPQLLLAPLLPIAVVLIYFDARIRDEGYDLELRAKEAGGGVTPDAGAPPAAPASAGST